MALYKSTDLTNKTVKIINDFQSGLLKPISSGIEHLDKACLGGFTPSLIVGITARSFSGKTYDLERIQKHVRENEPDVIQMHGNYELSFFKILVRSICQKTGKTQEEILYNQPTIEELKKLAEVCDAHRNDNIYYQNEPVTPEQFFDDVKFLIDAYPDKKILVTVDNLENILDTKGSQKSSIDAFLTQINRLKDMHWFICFIILNQLNDNILARIDNPKHHKPIESDIYSSGQYYKLCDVVYVKVLPWRLHIKEKFMVFPSHAYEWLEEFKLYNNNNASFEPMGVAYYFYLKRRGSDIKDTKDIFAERIFKEDKKEQQPSTPSLPNLFGEQTKTETPVFEKPVAPNFDLNSAFEPTVKKEEDDPF